jgi:signal transduction histidine kinase
VARLAADAAHETNNALQVVRLLHDEGEERRSPPPATRVLPQVERIEAVTELLTGIGRVPDEKPAPVDVGALLREAAERVELDPDALLADAEEGPPAIVSGHRELLRVVLEGLLQRASAAGRPPRVSLTVSEEEPDRTVEIRIESTWRQDSERTPAGQPASRGPLFLTFCRIAASLHGGRLDSADGPEGLPVHVLVLPGLARPDVEP